MISKILRTIIALPFVTFYWICGIIINSFCALAAYATYMTIKWYEWIDIGLPESPSKYIKKIWSKP